jgi:hypothetical protein
MSRMGERLEAMEAMDARVLKFLETWTQDAAGWPQDLEPTREEGDEGHDADKAAMSVVRVERLLHREMLWPLVRVAREWVEGECGGAEAKGRMTRLMMGATGAAGGGRGGAA